MPLDDARQAAPVMLTISFVNVRCSTRPTNNPALSTNRREAAEKQREETAFRIS